MRRKLKTEWWILQARIKQLPEDLAVWIAWRLPRTLVMWAAIRLMAHATTGAYGDQEPGKVSIIEALERWD